jgi:ribosomal-protein-alanine N-acetyltransferase
MTRHLRAVAARDLARLAALHAECFPEDRWDECALMELLAMPGASGHVIADAEEDRPLGFIVALIIAGEAEILTLCTAPAARRQGVARALLDDLFVRAIAADARSVGLEVAADNLSARLLYEHCGFAQSGRRRGYYRRGTAAIDALLFRRVLLH